MCCDRQQQPRGLLQNSVRWHAASASPPRMNWIDERPCAPVAHAGQWQPIPVLVIQVAAGSRLRLVLSVCVSSARLGCRRRRIYQTGASRLHAGVCFFVPLPDWLACGPACSSRRIRIVWADGAAVDVMKYLGGHMTIPHRARKSPSISAVPLQGSVVGVSGRLLALTKSRTASFLAFLFNPCHMSGLCLVLFCSFLHILQSDSMFSSEF
jgi:hypothetical protein